MSIFKTISFTECANLIFEIFVIIPEILNDKIWYLMSLSLDHGLPWFKLLQMVWGHGLLRCISEDNFRLLCILRTINWKIQVSIINEVLCISSLLILVVNFANLWLWKISPCLGRLSSIIVLHSLRVLSMLYHEARLTYCLRLHLHIVVHSL